MKTRGLVDAGPLVALVNRRDEHHAWAATQLRAIAPPLKTCEAALAEAIHLLERRPDHAGVPREMARRGFLDLDFSLRAELPAVHRADGPLLQCVNVAD